MTTTEKLAMLSSILGADAPDSATMTAFLNLAKQEILGWRYSYSSNTPEDVPAEYETTQIYAVVAGYTQVGAEGEVRHSENGIERTFKHESMVNYIRSHVVPIAGVI